MAKEDFGSFLREARERRHLSLAELSEATKVSQASLKALESGALDDLPAEIFVRGFIRSYAGAVGASGATALDLFEQALSARSEAHSASMLAPTPMPGLAGPGDGEEDGLAPRRGIGLAVFVIIVLLIATITLSLFLRQPPQSGEGLSQTDAESIAGASGVG